MKIWCVTGKSESGDELEPLLFSEKPDDKILREIAYNFDGDEEEEGFGDYGSYVYLDVFELEVDEFLNDRQ